MGTRALQGARDFLLQRAVGLPGEFHQAVRGPQGLQEVLGGQRAGEGAGDGKERGPRLPPPLQVQRGQQPRRQPLGAAQQLLQRRDAHIGQRIPVAQEDAVVVLDHPLRQGPRGLVQALQPIGGPLPRPAGGLLGVQPGFGGQLLRRKAALVQDADGLPEGDGDRVPGLRRELGLQELPVILAHVLEHLPDPVGEVLRAEGVVVCLPGGLDRAERGNELLHGFDEEGEGRAAERFHAIRGPISHSRLLGRAGRRIRRATSPS
jgi:hypothetical protein